MASEAEKQGAKDYARNLIQTARQSGKKVDSMDDVVRIIEKDNAWTGRQDLDFLYIKDLRELCMPPTPPSDVIGNPDPNVSCASIISDAGVPYHQQTPKYEIRIFHPQTGRWEFVIGMDGTQALSYISKPIVKRFKLPTEPPNGRIKEPSIRLNWFPIRDQHAMTSNSTRFRVISKDLITHDIVIGTGYEHSDNSDNGDDLGDQQEPENLSSEEGGTDDSSNEIEESDGIDGINYASAKASSEDIDGLQSYPSSEYGSTRQRRRRRATGTLQCVYSSARFTDMYQARPTPPKPAPDISAAGCEFVGDVLLHMAGKIQQPKDRNLSKPLSAPARTLVPSDPINSKRAHPPKVSSHQKTASTQKLSLRTNVPKGRAIPSEQPVPGKTLHTSPPKSLSQNLSQQQGQPLPKARLDRGKPPRDDETTRQQKQPPRRRPSAPPSITTTHPTHKRRPKTMV